MAVNIVGILQQDERGGVIAADRQSPYRFVWVAPNNLFGAPFGMKVVAELFEPVNPDQPTGKIIEVLGDPGSSSVELLSIIRSYGLDTEFPEAVLAEAAALPAKLTEEQIAEEVSMGRRDLRALKTFTIDGIDARDLDDAISIVKHTDGSYKLWIHIADVAYYVTPGSALDMEAQRRGNSTYLAGQVIPMLPPQLSNGICSLNPQQDRFALTVSLDIDPSGEITDGDVFPTVIRSDVRADYDGVRNSVDSGVAAPGHEAIMSEMRLAKELADKMRSTRVRAGLLEFEFPEMQITVDSTGKPIDIEAVEVTWAHELIEDFMIAANCYVAKRFHDLGAPLIYRVHEQPDIERLKSFVAVLRRLISIQMPKPAALMDVAGLAEILDRFKELPEGDILSGLLLRSLAKARYDTRCLGHFGLNEPYYAHYTAPIRRYADLIVHRVVRAYIAGRAPIKSKWVANLPQVAEHISETERRSMEAERASNDLRVAEYMSERIGERYPAIISGMHRAGFFCRLPNAVEGMVPYRLLGDYYDYDELTMTARGQSSGFELRLGMRLTVQVVEADPIRRSVTFYWFDQDEMVDRARSARSKAKRSSGKKSDKSAARSESAAEAKSSARKSKGSAKSTKTKKKRK